MNIIKTYIENMFSSLPNTKEINKMKNDLLLNMEEKYIELKANGKTENEAIGIVISEFGNIEELAEELGVDINTKENFAPVLKVSEAKEYINATEKNAKHIAIGVMLCILSPILIIFFASLNTFEDNTLNMIIGFITLFVLIATAVGLFIYAGINLDKYSYIKKEVIIPNSVKEYAKAEQNIFNRKYTISLILSVTMFILSPILLIILSVVNDEALYEKYNLGIGIVVLLALIAIGALMVVSVGIVKDAYNALLQVGDYSKERKENDKIVSAVAGIYWPVVTAGYLFWSFVWNDWHISWLIWPIAGVLFGGIAGIINAREKKWFYLFIANKNNNSIDNRPKIVYNMLRIIETYYSYILWRKE